MLETEHAPNKKRVEMQDKILLTQAVFAPSGNNVDTLSNELYSQKLFTVPDDLDLAPSFDYELANWLSNTESLHPLHIVNNHVTNSPENENHPVALLAEKTAHQIDPVPQSRGQSATKELAVKAAKKGGIVFLRGSLRVAKAGFKVYNHGKLQGAFS